MMGWLIDDGLDALVHSLIAAAIVAAAAYFGPHVAALAVIANAVWWPAREWRQNGNPARWGSNAWPEALLPAWTAAICLAVLYLAGAFASC